MYGKTDTRLGQWFYHDERLQAFHFASGKTVNYSRMTDEGAEQVYFTDGSVIEIEVVGTTDANMQDDIEVTYYLVPPVKL